MSAVTVVNADLGLTVRTDDEGTVILGGLTDLLDGEWHFTPDEARWLAGTLLRHSGQGGGFAALFEDDAMYLYGPNREPWSASPGDEAER